MWYKYFIKNTSGKKECFLGNTGTVQENIVYMYCYTVLYSTRNIVKLFQNSQEFNQLSNFSKNVLQV